MRGAFWLVDVNAFNRSRNVDLAISCIRGVSAFQSGLRFDVESAEWFVFCVERGGCECRQCDFFSFRTYDVEGGAVCACFFWLS
jgi:hypothetical protein